jgi:hypothetical protein
VNLPDPPQFKVKERPAVALLTAAETVIAPELSIWTFPEVSSVWRLVLGMVDAPADAAIQTPSTNDPLEIEPVLIVTDVGRVRIVTASVTEV